MKKIPTVYLRDETDRAHVTDEPNPDCLWVFAGEGVPTRKYDGVCTMFDGEHWWARREVKPDKTPPPGFQPEQRDEVTGKTVGWEPIGQSGFAKYHAEALHNDPPEFWQTGTYEMYGPRINGNPERAERHDLIPHGNAERLVDDFGVDSPMAMVRLSGALGWEGIVWHHKDGRMAKLKVRDLR